jgi:hypothetical protein
MTFYRVFNATEDNHFHSDDNHVQAHAPPATESYSMDVLTLTSNFKVYSNSK